MNGRPWTSAECDALRTDYSSSSTRTLEAKLSRSRPAIIRKANKLGLFHAPEMHGKLMSESRAFPLGSTRITTDGYLQRKVKATGHQNKDWIGEHLVLWLLKHGDIPEGCVIAFRDGNKSNVVIENLEPLTRAQVLERHSIHNLPKELVEVIHLNGVLKRQIRRYFREEQA